MSLAHAAVVAFALLSAACTAQAAGPPEIAIDRTECSHCGMLVSEPIFAAAYELHEQQPRVFDDIGCMLDALRREAAPPFRVWLQDANGSGWLNGNTAVVVASPHVSTPMSGGLLAYADAAAASTAAAAHRGEVIGSVPELMARKGAAK